jgi:SAM-dependent methyltransferase
MGGFVRRRRVGHRHPKPQCIRLLTIASMGETTGYVGPMQTLQAVLANNGNIHGEILDAGCGTGLTGVALASQGATIIDGIDLSPGMLRAAERTGKYRHLATADMLKPLRLPSDKYDVVTCVGTFTTGHVGPVPAFPELLRVLKAGGIFVSTVLDNIWVSDGFEAEVERLGQSGTVTVVSTEVKDYRLADQAKARMVVLRKNLAN